jgi:hypothetical protein
MKDFPSALPLDPIYRASSLDHGHEASWWWERFFFDDMLDCGGLEALLHHVCRRVSWWWRCIVSHATCDRLLGSHLVLKRLTGLKELLLVLE